MAKYIILLIIIIIICTLYLYNTENEKEPMTNISNEALQNISELYNQANLSISNITVTNGGISNGVPSSALGGDLGLYSNKSGGNIRITNKNGPIKFYNDDLYGINNIGAFNTDGSFTCANNTLKFSSGWTGYPENIGNAEISNDTSQYKTLMIVGNRSAQGQPRTVGVWDNLTINGNLNVTSKLNTNGRIMSAPINGGQCFDGYDRISDSNQGSGNQPSQSACANYCANLNPPALCALFNNNPTSGQNCWCKTVAGIKGDINTKTIAQLIL
jgi:hypothetical protein